MKQTIYYGGDILTMEEPITVEAILVKDGIIAQAGSLRDILAQKEEETVLEHLHGKTLLPAFLDPHSHITALASTMGLAPLDGADSFDDIVSRLEDFRKKQTISSGQWLTGFGYDHNFLKEKAHPTKEVLDRAFPDTPVLITHASGHMGVVNSAALAALGVTSRTPDPEGGKIGRMDGTMEPNGYLEETAFTALSSKLPQPTMGTASGPVGCGTKGLSAKWHHHRTGRVYPARRVDHAQSDGKGKTLSGGRGGLCGADRPPIASYGEYRLLQGISKPAENRRI